MNKKKLLKFLRINIEGAIVGAVLGVLAVYASLGLGTLPSIALWQKIFIAPVVIAGWLLPSDVSGGVAIATAILVGIIIGVAIDAVYKPKQ